jgi:hypothetical protein
MEAEAGDGDRAALPPDHMPNFQDATGPVSLQIPRDAPRLFIVEYPGFVKNKDRALETLGGLEGIARQLQEDASLLPLRFRPEDPYSHTIHAERSKTNRVVVKLVRRRRAHQQGEGASSAGSVSGSSGLASGYEVTAQVVGRADTVYRWVALMECSMGAVKAKRSSRVCSCMMPSSMIPEPVTDCQLPPAGLIHPRFSTPADYQYVGVTPIEQQQQTERQQQQAEEEGARDPIGVPSG